MKRLYLVSLFVIAALALAPLSTLAQDDEEWQTYTSEDGKLTASYPPGWFAQKPGEDLPFPGVYIAASEDTLEKMNGGGDVSAESGEIVVFVVLIPTDFLIMLGIEVPEDATTEDLTNAMVNLINAPEEEMEEEQATPEATPESEEPTPEPTMEPEPTPVMGEFQEVDLGEGVMAGLVTTTAVDEEGAVIVREIQEGVVLLVYGLTFPGEFDEDLQNTFTRIAGSIQYTGTAEDVINTMMAPADTETTTLDGETLINERCTVCHTRERIDQADKDEAGWTETVDRMIGYGAVLNAEERDALIAYLAETH